MSFKKIDITELKFNPFTKIGSEWFLVSSGDKNGWNTMTASWGFMGVIWGKPVCETVIRHNRYTYEFMEKNELFTISFFGEKYRKALAFCGANSGRDCDKAAETGLTPFFTDGTVSFEESELIFVCRKRYAADLMLDLLDKELKEQFYSADPVHKQYIGEIIAVYRKN